MRLNGLHVEHAPDSYVSVEPLGGGGDTMSSSIPRVERIGILSIL
jgi:hypothetical protein